MVVKTSYYYSTGKNQKDYDRLYKMSVPGIEILKLMTLVLKYYYEDCIATYIALKEKGLFARYTMPDDLPIKIQVFIERIYIASGRPSTRSFRSSSSRSPYSSSSSCSGDDSADYDSKYIEDLMDTTIMYVKKKVAKDIDKSAKCLILNPKTKRPVNISGKIGIKLLKDAGLFYQ